MPVGKKKTSRGKGKAKGTKPRPSPPRRKTARAVESAEFVAGLIRRGEAAYPMEDGRLPPGATHEIVDGEPGEPPTVVRRRFSIT